MHRVLLIDDDARLSAMVGDYLRAAGFEVEPLAFQAEGHVGQIEHGWVFAAVVGAEIVVGGGVMGVRIHGGRVTW